MKITEYIKEIITELYFEKLEDNLVNFTYENDIGNGQVENLVKDEYIESVENMIDYIWGLDTDIGMIMYEVYLETIKPDETNEPDLQWFDTCTEYGYIKTDKNNYPSKESEVL